jgi:hypothetical protein
MAAAFRAALPVHKSAAAAEDRAIAERFIRGICAAYDEHFERVSARIAENTRVLKAVWRSGEQGFTAMSDADFDQWMRHKYGGEYPEGDVND